MLRRLSPFALVGLVLGGFVVLITKQPRSIWQPQHHRPSKDRARVPAVMLILALLVILGPTRLPVASAQTAPPERPNVLFIAIDDLNDWVGVLRGHPQVKTPNIDRLAKRGILFANAHTNAPLCSPSRESLFSGRLPSTTGFYTFARGDSSRKPRYRYETIPEHFQAHGYRTLGTGKLFHWAGNEYPEAFDAYGPGIGDKGGPFLRKDLRSDKQNPTHRVTRGSLDVVLPMNQMPNDRRFSSSEINSFDWGPVDVPDEAMADSKMADWAVEKLQKGHTQPFFLGVGFYRPHQPLYAPQKYFDLYPEPSAITLPEVIPNDLSDVPRVARDFGVLPFSAGRQNTVARYGQWSKAVRAYLACVSFIDAQVGRLLDALDRSPHADNTVVVLWSDHGYHLGTKRHWGKWTGWEPATHVPLIVVPAKDRPPEGFTPGGRSDRAVSLVDIYPTLSELCDLPTQKGLDGRSLLPLVKNPGRAWDRPAITTIGYGSHSIRTDRWRLIHYFDGSEELYDLYADPHEWYNLAGDPKYAVIKQRLVRWVPDHPEVAHFVRMGPWKAVLYKDRAPLLFKFAANSGQGIGEGTNLAEKQPKVLSQITDYLQTNQITAKHVVIRKDKPNEASAQ